MGEKGSNPFHRARMLSVLLFFLLFFFFATLLSVRHNEKLSPRLQVRKYIVDDDEDSKSARHLRRGQGGRNAAYIVNEFSQTESINVHNYYWYV